MAPGHTTDEAEGAPRVDAAAGEGACDPEARVLEESAQPAGVATEGRLWQPARREDEGLPTAHVRQSADRVDESGVEAHPVDPRAEADAVRGAHDLWRQVLWRDDPCPEGRADALGDASGVAVRCPGGADYGGAHPGHATRSRPSTPAQRISAKGAAPTWCAREMQRLKEFLGLDGSAPDDQTMWHEISRGDKLKIILVSALLAVATYLLTFLLLKDEGGVADVIPTLNAFLVLSISLSVGKSNVRPTSGSRR